MVEIQGHNMRASALAFGGLGLVRSVCFAVGGGYYVGFDSGGY